MVQWHRDKTCVGQIEAVASRAVDLRVIAFERWAAFDAGPRSCGRLHYAISDRGYHVLLSMTWEALSRLRDEVRRAGAVWPDSVIIARCLQTWGADQIAALYRAGRTPPPGGLSLDFGCGPLSDAPRSLLERSGLLARSLPPAA